MVNRLDPRRIRVQGRTGQRSPVQRRRRRQACAAIVHDVPAAKVSVSFIGSMGVSEIEIEDHAVRRIPPVCLRFA